MNRKSVSYFFLALLLSVTNHSRAQVANGDFSTGPDNWQWKKAQSSIIIFDDCINRLSVFTPTMQNTPAISSQSGRAAEVVSTIAIGTGTLDVCGEIEQQVFVTPGARLNFHSQTGTLTTAISSSTVTLTNEVADVSTGIIRHLFSTTGSSTTQPSFAPQLIPRSVDISEFWGRTVKIKFRGVSRAILSGRLSTSASPAFIDNVALEAEPTDFRTRLRAGNWHNPSRTGHGIHLSRSSDDKLSITWFTYLPNGRPVWYISSADFMINGIWNSTLYRSTWNPATQTNTLAAIGDVRIQTLSDTRLNFLWDFHSDGNQAGFDDGEPMSHLWGGESYTGMWYEPALTGWGVSVDHKANSNGIDTIATAFYYEGSEPVWAQGTAEGSPGSGQVFQLNSFTRNGLCPQCFGQAVSVSSWPVGVLELRLDTNKGWIDIQEQSGARWSRGSSSQPAGIFRLTFP